MPDVLSEFPEEEGAAAANNNPNEINSDYLESELWKALRNDNQERFQSLLDTVQAGTLYYTEKNLLVCHYPSDTDHQNADDEITA